jgi:hypothetical protein
MCAIDEFRHRTGGVTPRTANDDCALYRCAVAARENDSAASHLRLRRPGGLLRRNGDWR